MIDTTKITSGFDVEFQLGARWFLTALRGLNERGLLIQPGSIPFVADDAVITIDSVEIIFTPADRDLRIDVTIGDSLSIPILASVQLSEDGKNLILSNSINADTTTVPFDALSGLAAPPKIVKLRGDENTESVLCVLANMDIRASSQRANPLPAGEHMPRGNPDDAQAFLPLGKDMTLGVSKETLQRFANDIWHSQLTDDQGRHPFPDAENEQGTWRSVSMAAHGNKIRVTLKAKANVDSPVIDLIPDPDITVTVDLTPKIDNGKLTFEITSDANIDFGILGDLLAALVGGIIGFVIGLFTGNPIGGAIAGAVAGIVILEVTEVIIGGIIAKEIQAKIDGQPLTQFYRCKNDVVHLATKRNQGQGLNLGFLDSLPSSIPIFTDNPDPLHKRFILINHLFDGVTLNSGGFAAEGATAIGEKYSPENASLVDKVIQDENLTELIYRAEDGTIVNLPIQEAISRADSDDVPEPLNVIASSSQDLVQRKKDGKIPIACMHPVAIHREKTIVTGIRFGTGLELQASETIMLQDAGVLILPNMQLIHPSNARPYYRAPADDTTENNFESLPEF
ncbi:MAG: hypothetical protein JW731_15100 [Bacteroidales bacterium]|nr:hypothetical protein [Bacteroidales bacterium]